MSNITFPKPLGLCGSTKVILTLIHASYFEIWSQTRGASMHGEREKNDNLIEMIV